MIKEYFTDNIRVETLAEFTDKLLNFEKNAKQRRLKSNLLKIIPAVAAVLLVVGLMNLTNIFTFLYTPDISKDFYPEFQAGITSETGMTADERHESSYNFLILGKDNGLLTDAMMLVNYNITDGEINILNIPRDTHINNDYHSGRINSVYAAGFNKSRNEGKALTEASADGINNLRSVIKYTLGIPVDRYIRIDLAGFRTLIDALGGVEMEVPADMYYADPHQDLYIDLKKGMQTLDGEKAEQLVRFRSGYPTADIGRIETQQKFVSAVLNKILKFDLKQINSLFEFAGNHIDTNLSAMDTAWFAVKMLDLLPENIKMHILPGKPAQAGAASVWKLNKNETVEMINSYFNPYGQNIPADNFNISE